MSDRHWLAILVVLAAALLGVQFEIKPGFDPEEIRSAASAFAAPAEWKGRLAEDFEISLRDGSTFRLGDHIALLACAVGYAATVLILRRRQLT
jgi:hypothetical protein